MLTADHSTLLLLPGFFFLYRINNFLFLLCVNLCMITGIYLHDRPPFNGPFFMSPPFSESQKVVTLPLFPPLPPLLISDKSLTRPCWATIFYPYSRLETKNILLIPELLFSRNSVTNTVSCFWICNDCIFIKVQFHFQVLRGNPSEVRVTSGQKLSTNIIYTVLQTSFELF